MSYLDPRVGPTPAGDRSPEPGAPAPGYWAPEPGAGPSWDAPTAMTSTSEAEHALSAGPGPRGPGRRRASGRAGRNLPAAIAVGVALCVVVLASLVVWKDAFVGVIVLAAGVGVWEMSRALRISGAQPPIIPLLGGTALMIGLSRYAGDDAVVLGLVVTVLAAVLWRLADRPPAPGREITAIVLIVVYVPFLISFAMPLSAPDDGHWRVLCTLLAVVLSDTGGYAAGVFLGKHPMAPKISPKKSWEGFGGSVTAAAVGSALLLYFLLDVPLYWGLLFGAVISVVAVIGDLAESMLKRDLGIKDMSRLLPGHGGLMDRLDSILFAVPVAYLLLSLVAQPG